MDRINVGGNESGQQAGAVWSVDGVVITDTAALGTRSGYVNFDVFEQMIPTFPEAEAKSLCAEIAAGRLDGDHAGARPRLPRRPRRRSSGKPPPPDLLHGFLASILVGKGCSEPPADVLAEARRYAEPFARPKG